MDNILEKIQRLKSIISQYDDLMDIFIDSGMVDMCSNNPDYIYNKADELYFDAKIILNLLETEIIENHLKTIDNED